MPHKGQLSAEEKIRLVKDYLSGKRGYTDSYQVAGVHYSTFEDWVRLFQARGSEGLLPTEKNRKYSVELKNKVTREYLKGGISLSAICTKYDITTESIVRRWIKRYNCHGEFRTPNSGGEIYMVKGRNTNLEERIEAVQDCLSNGKDYGQVVEKHKVSYQQVYTWVRKYEENGIDGLADRRGKRKDESNMTEVERLRAELKLTQAKLKRAEVENELLKKVEEIERRRD
jgi:transposase